MFTTEVAGTLAVTAVPIHDEPGERWIVADNGALFEVDTQHGTRRRIAPCPVGDVVLTTDRSGQYIAVASTYGARGTVIEAESGAEMLALDRGDYYAQMCRFPLAFAEYDGRPVLVHATNWNRLDVTDPATGASLTERHDVDYFFCGLRVSPNSQWIVTDGWTWHPWGIVCAWNLQTWLDTGRFPEWFTPDPRHEKWDGPLTWLDDRRLAIGNSSNVRIYDVVDENEISSFAGPADALESDGRYLYSLSPGLSVFDIATGRQVVDEPTVAPLARHSRTGRCLLTEDQIVDIN